MSERIPALFIGHGNPMNALLVNPYTEWWAALGSALLRPKTILSVSGAAALLREAEVYPRAPANQSPQPGESLINDVYRSPRADDSRARSHAYTRKRARLRPARPHDRRVERE